MILNAPKLLCQLIFLGLKRFLIPLLLILVLLPASGSGMEIFRFLDDQCQGDTGLIIAVNHEWIKLINLEGRLTQIPQNNLTHILVYYSLENPLEEIQMQREVINLAREVYTSDSENPSFIGWAVRFMEDQVVFFTTEGSLSLVSIDNINRLERSNQLPGVQQLGNYKKRGFILGQGFPDCEPEEPQPDDLRPIRVLGDQIKIHKFLNSYHEGFEDLRRFQELTQFYAKPFLFPKETRLGLPLTVMDQTGEFPSFFPFYFQWSSGRPYSHQAVTSLGNKASPWLPLLEPLMSIQADFKSHFFNASYVGNPLGMAAGADFLVEGRVIFSDFYAKMVNQPVFLLPHFNYMALSGIDYGPYSISGGVFYPIYALHGGGIFREVLSTKASPIFRFIYHQGERRFKLLYSQFDSGGDNPGLDQMRLFPSFSLSNPGLSFGAEQEIRQDLTSYQLKVDFLRFGLEGQWNKNINWGLEGLILVGNYQETYQEREQGLKTRQTHASIYGTQNFGNYVELRGQLNLYHRSYEYDFDNQTDSHLEQQQSIVGSIEFFF